MNNYMSKRVDGYVFPFSRESVEGRVRPKVSDNLVYRLVYVESMEFNQLRPDLGNAVQLKIDHSTFERLKKQVQEDCYQIPTINTNEIPLYSNLCFPGLLFRVDDKASQLHGGKNSRYIEAMTHDSELIKSFAGNRRFPYIEAEQL